MADHTANRIHNSTNPFQGSARRVLAVCSAGLLRSPTTANVLHAKYGFNTRACGVFEEFALIPMDAALIYWAQEIVFVNRATRDAAFARFPEQLQQAVELGTAITTLNIPDEYEWNAPELRRAIERQYEDASTP